MNGTSGNDTITTKKAPIGQPKPGGLNDKLYGFEGDDNLDGGAGGDLLTGGNGNDKYTIDNELDVVVETANGGNVDIMQSKVISFTLVANVERGLVSGSLALNITGNGSDNTLTGNNAVNVLNGLGGKDKLYGKDGADTLHGGAENDLLSGDDDNDMLYGEDGVDMLDGGQGSDQLWGGLGADKFKFVADALIGGAIDVIHDFSGSGGQGDKIDLKSIDADGAGGASNGTFAFIGLSAFSGVKGQLRYSISGENTVIEADIDGNSSADLTIILTGAQSLQATDFVL